MLTSTGTPMPRLSHLAVAFATLALTLTLADRAAQACTTPCEPTGAVSKPSGFDIGLPFEDGERVRLLSGYGPSAGSSLHCRSQDTSCANDYYALDLVLPDHADFGKGQPVVAIASGTILDAGWGSAGWAAYGERVYIEHDFDDGHTYVSMYAHLDSVSVSTGQRIEKGETLGTLGGSCNGSSSCGNFSTPHVHFALHRDSNFGGSGSGGSYGGRAVIPEPIDGYTGLTQGDILTSHNDGGGGGEDPPPCEVIIGDQPVIIEEDSACATVVGGPLQTTAGHDGGAFHMPAAHAEPDYANGLFWFLKFSDGGSYEVDAHITDSLDGLTRTAVYKVQYAGQSTTLHLDQQAHRGQWANLGRYDFAADTGDDQWVRLGDNFGQSADQHRPIVIDALRISPAAQCVCHSAGELDYETCAGGGQRQRQCDGCQWGAWGECVVSAEDAGNDSGQSADTPEDTTIDTHQHDDTSVGQPGDVSNNPPDGAGDTDATSQETRISAGGGCGCSGAGGGRPVVPLAAVLLMLFGLRRCATFAHRDVPGLADP